MIQTIKDWITNLFSSLFDCEEIYKSYCKKHRMSKSWWGSTPKGEKFVCSKCEEEGKKNINY